MDSASRAEKRRVATFIFPSEVLPATPVCTRVWQHLPALASAELSFLSGFLSAVWFSLSAQHPPPPFSAVSAPFTGVWLEGQSGGVNIWHCLCSSVFVHTSKNVCVCSAWHLSHHLHLPPRYPACFCRLRRQPPHRQLPQPFFLDLTPETPLPPFVSQLLNIWD